MTIAKARRSWIRTGGVVIPLVVSGLALSGSLFSQPAVRDAVTLAAVDHVRLTVGPWFVLFSPIYNIWDSMSLLHAWQHLCVLGITVTAFVLWRCCAARGQPRIRLWREVVQATVALALLVAWYAIGALAYRPMASLDVDDPDAVVVDFHSHTDASHDGRPGFSAERNREWHRSAGFHVAYVSDHGTYSAVREALSRNPVRSGDGTVLLPAYETRHKGQHFNVLGFSAAASNGFSPPPKMSSLPLASDSRAVLTLPTPLAKAAPGEGLVAIELIDGSPRGLEFGARMRKDLVRLCTQLGVAPVAGSNNHGWGRTAPGWTLLTIPGWRNLTPVQLDEAILAALASPERGRVIVIERAPPVSADRPVLMANVSTIVWNPFRRLSVPEQVSWVAWVWLAWWILRVARRPRGPQDARSVKGARGQSSQTSP